VLVADKRETRAVLFILIAVLAYSGLPVLGVYSLDSLEPSIFVAKSFFQYSFLQACVWLLAIVLLRKRVGAAPRVLPQTRKTYASLAIAGLLIAASYTCLFTSFYFINKAGASVLYETWPIFVTIGLPLFFSQRFERLSPSDVVYVLLAFVGVTMIISASGDTEQSNYVPFAASRPAVTGYVLATSSGLTMAIAVIVKTNLMKKVDLDRGAIPIVAFLECTHRGIGAVALYLFAILVAGVTPTDLFRVDVSTAFAAMELVGASTFWYAIIATRKSTINVLWYAAPMLAVVWLSILGLAEVSALIVIGAVLIITANILTRR